MKLEAHASAAGATPAKPDAAHTAAKQLEAFFLRRMLSEARPAGGDGLDAGFAGDTFKQMFDEAIADKMSAAGGIGMADMLAAQLTKGAGNANADALSASEVATAGAGARIGSRGLPRGAAVDGVAGTGATPAAGELAAAHPLATGPLPAGYTGPALALPVVGRASSGYGMRSDPIQHTEIKHPGFDFAAPTGTQVDAAAAGTVTHAGPAGTYGNLVTIRHASGYETRYAHLSAVSVQVGDHVAAGAAVGAVGTTGYSTGPHLHFEVRHDGEAIDPAPLLPLSHGGVKTYTSALNKSPDRANR